jgi:hypothetical protein
MAGGTILTWLWCTLVNVDFAIASFVSSSALASVVGHAVNTCSSMLARIIGAIVNIDFAIHSCVSLGAFASVFIDSIDANTSVLT